MNHSRYGASSMSRWSVCPGSVAHLEKYPTRTSEAAREGTEAHEWGEYKIIAAHDGKEMPICLDEDMEEHTNYYRDYVMNLYKDVDNTFGDAKLQVEQRFVLDHIREDAFGTNDACVFANFGELHIIDLKYGKSKVYAKENKQLLYYALGAVQQNGIDPLRIVLHVVQPRVKPQFNSWELTLADLLRFEAELVEAIERVDEQPDLMVPGSHCHWCNKTKCPAYRENELAKMSTEPEDLITLL